MYKREWRHRNGSTQRDRKCFRIAADNLAHTSADVPQLLKALPLSTMRKANTLLLHLHNCRIVVIIVYAVAEVVQEWGWRVEICKNVDVPGFGWGLFRLGFCSEFMNGCCFCCIFLCKFFVCAELGWVFIVKCKIVWRLVKICSGAMKMKILRMLQNTKTSSETYTRVKICIAFIYL